MGKVSTQLSLSKKAGSKESKRSQAKRSMAKGVKPRLEVLPVTLLSGFLGSGKTSLLTHLLHHRHGLRVAVILNEISEINIDVLALEGAHILHSEEKVVEMSNGCICCTLREDLLKTLRALHAQQGFHAVLVESSGIAEPMQVAETFFVDLGDGLGQLQTKAPLHNCVTVVDGSTLKQHLNDPRAAMAIDPKAKDEKEDQSVGELLIQQIEFANVIILNKVDLLTGEVNLEGALNHRSLLGEVVALIRSVNPTADIIPAVRCEVDAQALLATQRFTESWANSVLGWMEDIASGVKHTPETLEYGIGSFLYTADRPFHPQWLYDWVDKNYYWLEIVTEVVEVDEEEDVALSTNKGAHEKEEENPAAVVGQCADVAVRKEEVPLFGEKEKQLRDAAYGNFFRSKGFVWLGNPDRLPHVMEWSQAGTVLNLQYTTTWDHFSTQERGQRLVFIGQDIKSDVLTRDLDTLLLTVEEWSAMQRGDYDKAPLQDPFRPFPSFSSDDDDDDDITD